MSNQIEQCEILRRICDRGCSYFLDKEDSTGIDLFEHMRNEVAVLKSALIIAEAGEAEFVKSNHTLNDHANELGNELIGMQASLGQMIAELLSLPRLDYVMYNDGYTEPYPSMEEAPHGEYCAHSGIQRIIDKYGVKHE